MGWKKLGRVFVAEGHRPWAMTHAYVPTALALNEKRIRVYAAFLDRDRVGRVGFVEVDAANPLRVLRVSDDPVLDIGSPGAFDEHGVTPTSLVSEGEVVRLYYMGWQRGNGFPYRSFTGVAESGDGGLHFIRRKEEPVLAPSISKGESMLRSAACVLPEENRWRLWYVAGDAWIEVAGKPVPTYGIRHLESSDGIEWGSRGTVCLDPVGPDEFGFGRPFVVREPEGFHMWYSVRSVSRGYRLGYAESSDGLSWRRRDERAGLTVSPGEWDSEMVAFACEHRTAHGTYLFYNGNRYGETGFGVAVWE